jgi:hypothetical protein
MMLRRALCFIVLVSALFLIPARFAFAQLDQGTITGVVQDQTGAVVSGASVTLTNLDEGLVLKTKTDASGIYVFSPIKIGDYKVSVSAAGFATTTQTNLHLSIQQRLNVVIALKPGATTETITVSTEEPLMQTQESSVGQTMDAQQINSIPLNGRNWLYVAQLAAGADPPEGSRGQGKGDFNANGQRAEENNFILDGIDNNANVVDFYNGASFVVQPPPDALAEMKVQTSDYSAEFGHSAGAVVNASIKSGTNNLHGSAWEYLRNTDFDIHDWEAEALPVPAYHENQFGATLGGPILRNKLFLFGDAQANRIRFAETTTETVPDAMEKAGDFSELMNTALTGAAPVQLYYQSPDAPPVAITNNCLVTSQYCTASQGLGITLNQTAQTMLGYYPTPGGNPNATAGLLYNNFTEERPVVDDTFQWDVRMDWNIGAKDTLYSRHSYWNEVGLHVAPLGDILDGGGFGDDGPQKDMGQSFMTSETHVFTQTLTNEARVGFTYLHTGFQQPNAADLSFAQTQGFGGIPTAPLNGGLPGVSVGGISGFGSPTWAATDEHENVYEIIDNVTKVKGNHSLKAGVSFESIRFSTLQPQQSRGTYNYNGEYTSNLSAANTGYGVADFLLDMQNSAGLSNEVTNGDARWDNAVYFQDDWRLNQKFTLNLGLRWEHFQPYQDVGGYQASYNMTGPPSLNTTTGYGSGMAQYQVPAEAKGYAAPIISQYGFDNVLAKDNIALVYTGDPHIVQSQKTNFGPRIGIAFSPDARTTIRAGFGIFYGGLESIGYYPNLGENYPFQYEANFPSNSCGTNNCPTDGITIANGFATIVANGFASDVEDLALRGSDPIAKTPYTEDYNLTIERGIGNDIAATLSYVGDVSRHMQVFPDPNGSLAYENPANSTQNARPLPDFGGTSYTSYGGMSDYNGLQAKIEKRMAHGYNLLATYTWSHSLDDAPTPLGSTGDGGFRETNLIPIKLDYSNSPFDTRQRFTFNALYQIPFGIGRQYLNTSRALDYLVGGWSANADWVAQTGNPFTVYPSGISGPAGSGTRAIKVKNPYTTGGTFVSPNPTLVSSVTCAAKTKNRTNWYNPCSFENPWDAKDTTYEPDHYIPASTSDPNTPVGDNLPVYVTDLSTVLAFSGGVRDQVPGPGYERVNMSIFKDFKTYREQYLTFRADGFNLFNTPSLGQPSQTGTNTAGGQITGPRTFQNDSPDSRFFQLSLKYEF